MRSSRPPSLWSGTHPVFSFFASPLNVLAAGLQIGYRTVNLWFRRGSRPPAATPVGASLLLDRRRRARKRVADVEINGVIVRGLRRAGGHVPGITIQPFVLIHQVDGAVPGVLPNRVVQTQSDFLYAAVLAVGRAGVAVADGLAVGVHGYVAADVNAAVVAVEHHLRAHVGFEALDEARRVN